MTVIDNRKKRSPIKESPLREAGQSLRERALDEAFSSWMAWAIMAVFATLLAVMAWVQWVTDVQLDPWWITGMAGVCAIVAAWQGNRTRRKLRNYKLGLKGERHVGQFLQSTLIPRGYHVLHDICFDGYNIDHVAIGPGGVFAIEVKTWSKHEPSHRIQYDGKEILRNGLEPDRNAVAQAQANANTLKGILKPHIGKEFYVRPVVLFPGWWIEGSSSGKAVWVLNEKGLPGFIDKEPVQLSAHEIALLYEGLAAYVRRRLMLEGYED